MQEINFSGLIKINKPVGITSYDCIRHIKRILNIKKVKIGHAGTLDPFASGLMLICIGREATKTIDQLMTQDKEYLVKAKLGELTDTLDLTGKVLESKILESKTINPSLTKQDIEKAIKELGSSYIQTPPIYSALKHQGKPLYELAREQKMETHELEEIVQKKSRLVEIYKIELLNVDLPFFTFRAHVSKGTYIRSLAEDIAQKLDLHATTYELERTKIGDYKLEDAVKLYDLKTVEDIKGLI
ncbi:MAG: tRNA pseudouridine(55) synthase TruB [bacterium]